MNVTVARMLAHFSSKYYSKMVRIFVVLELVFIAGSGQGTTKASEILRPVFTYYETPLNFQSARKLCQDKGKALASPSDGKIQNELVSYLHAENISQAWLDGQQTLFPWKWVTDAVPLLDQGCYNVGEMTQSNVLAFSMADYMDFGKCFLACAKTSSQEVSIQLKPGNLYDCSCGRGYGQYGQADLSKCPGLWSCSSATSAALEYCGGQQFYVRVFRIGGNVSISWSEHASSSQLCGALVKDSGQFFLRTSRCRDERKYICALPKEESSSCVEGRSVFCLVPSLGEKHWSEARHACIQQGGDLAYVSSDMRIDDLGIWSEATPNAWVGVTASHWRWKTEDRDFTFTRWDQGEPIDPFINGCLKLVNNGKWQTYPCSWPLPTICTEYVRVTTVTTSASSPIEVAGATQAATASKNTGRLIGLVVGIILALILLIALIIVFIVLRRKSLIGGPSSASKEKCRSSSTSLGFDAKGSKDTDSDSIRNSAFENDLNDETEVKRAVSGGSSQYKHGSRSFDDLNTTEPQGFGPNQGADVVVNPIFDEVIETETKETREL